jgi:sugar phosphate isomerase/epimerase
VNATRDQETFKKGMETFEDQVKFAAAVGCSRMMVVILPASDTPKEELRKTLLRRFHVLEPVLARYNVRCGFEFLGPLHFRQGPAYPFIWHMSEMVEFAKDCGPNSSGVGCVALVPLRRDAGRHSQSGEVADRAGTSVGRG